MSSSSSELSSSPSEEKVCCACGESVSGKKRLKDEYGQYWCIPCAEKDEAKKHGQRVACPDCGRMIREEAMIAVELTKVCPRCYKERQELAKKNPTIRTARYNSEYRKHEIQKIKTLGAFAAGLAILALWQFDILPDFGRGQSEVRQLMWTAIMLGLVALAFLLGIIFWVRKNF